LSVVAPTPRRVVAVGQQQIENFSSALRVAPARSGGRVCGITITGAVRR
jgi:hypothetical protein